MKKVEKTLKSDTLFEVLSRVPVKVLLEKYMVSKDEIKTISYIPIETRGDKVNQTVFSFLPEDVVILASCKGLVCCRSFLSSPKPNVYVCNPSNKEWFKIECLVRDRCESIALAFDFDPSKDSFDISTKFTLVRVKPADNNGLYLTFELYSSDTGAWRKLNENCKCDNNLNLIKNKGIYIGGVLHWLTDGDQILTFDVKNEMPWLIPVPIPAFEFRTVPEACIGELEGRLHYVLTSEEGLHLWFLEDYYEFKWTLKHWKSLEEFEGEYPQLFFNLKNRVSQRVRKDQSPWMNPLGFKDGLLLLKVGSNLYLYDFKINNMVKACSFAKLNSNSMPQPTVLPHTLSLIPLNHT